MFKISKKNCSQMPEMTQSFKSGVTNSLVAKNLIEKTFCTSQISIAILAYVEAEIEYRPFYYFTVKLCTKKSSQFE